MNRFLSAISVLFVFSALPAQAGRGVPNRLGVDTPKTISQLPFQADVPPGFLIQVYNTHSAFGVDRPTTPWDTFLISHNGLLYVTIQMNGPPPATFGPAPTGPAWNAAGQLRDPQLSARQKLVCRDGKPWRRGLWFTGPAVAGQVGVENRYIVGEAVDDQALVERMMKSIQLPGFEFQSRAPLAACGAPE